MRLKLLILLCLFLTHFVDAQSGRSTITDFERNLYNCVNKRFYDTDTLQWIRKYDWVGLEYDTSYFFYPNGCRESVVVYESAGVMSYAVKFSEDSCNAILDTIYPIGFETPYQNYHEDSINRIDEEGRKQGHWIYFGKDRPESGYPANGKIEEGPYRNDRKEGLWIKYHKDGKTPKLKGEYRNNRPKGHYVKYYATGVLRESGLFVRGKHHGELKRYFESGQLQCLSTWDSLGKETGKTVYFFENGCIESEIVYMVGKLLESTRYYKDTCNKVMEIVKSWSSSGCGVRRPAPKPGNEREVVQLPLNQLSTDALIERFSKMETTELGIDAKEYWLVVRRGMDAVPILISRLADSTTTNIQYNCKDSSLTIGDVCYFALNQIADFPTFEVTGTQFCVIQGECWTFLDYLFEQRNKQSYQQKVWSFYEDNCENYKYRRFRKSQRTEVREHFYIYGRYILNP